MRSPRIQTLVGARVLLWIGGDAPRVVVATVREVDPDATAWSLEDGQGAILRLPLDLRSVGPGRPGRVELPDAGEAVDSPEWVAHYRCDDAGELLPADLAVHPLVGQRSLVGITYRDASGDVVGQDQWFGEIVRVGDDGIAVDVDGDVRLLPPDPLAFRGAARGEYRLRATGAVVVDPDLLSTWTVTRAA